MIQAGSPVETMIQYPHVRRAEPRDIDSIIRLCRESFAKASAWKAPRSLVYRWWRDVMASDACEVWTLEIESGVVGVLLLIIHEQPWGELKRRWCMSTPVQAMLMLTRPQILYGKIQRRLRITRTSPPRREKSADAKSAKSRVWFDLMAVSPAHRGHGYGSRLFQVGIERTAFHKRDRLEFVADPGNQGAQRLWTSLAGEPVARVSAGVLFSLARIPMQPKHRIENTSEA